MPVVESGKIRNVAVTGHRGTGKTSLVEAMLFQAGAVNRLGTIEQGSTVGDWDEDDYNCIVTVCPLKPAVNVLFGELRIGQSKVKSVCEAYGTGGQDISDEDFERGHRSGSKKPAVIEDDRVIGALRDLGEQVAG